MGRLVDTLVRGSLWIRPEEPAQTALNDVIRSIRYRYGGPGAKPHITLARGIECGTRELESRLEVLAAQVPRFTIQLGEIGWQEDYWRCVFVRVERSRELLEAHRAACEAFGLKADPAFDPHVSLLYGEFALERKQQMAIELGHRLFGVSFTATAVQFVTAAPDIAVDDWETVREYPLLPGRGAGEKSPNPLIRLS